MTSIPYLPAPSKRCNPRLTRWDGFGKPSLRFHQATGFFILEAIVVTVEIEFGAAQHTCRPHPASIRLHLTNCWMTPTCRFMQHFNQLLGQ